MPEWRKLHTRVLRSPDFHDLPDDFARLTWCLLMFAMDSAGRCLDNPALIRSTLYPLRSDVTEKQIQKALDAFAEQGMIVRYQARHRGYFYVPNWEKYQGNPERRREADPECPPPPDTDGLQEVAPSTPREPRENSATESATESATLSQQDKRDKTRQERAAPNGAGESSLSNEDRAQLERTFCERTRLDPPKRETQGQRRHAAELWWNPLRELAELVDCDIGRAEQLIGRALEKLDGRVTISSPKSLLKTAQGLVAEERRNGQGRALRVEV